MQFIGNKGSTELLQGLIPMRFLLRDCAIRRTCGSKPNKLRLVTFVPHSSELFRFLTLCRRLYPVPMQDISVQSDRRRQDRVQAVLPVRIRGIDTAGVAFEDLAHTLDLTPTGVRLGAIRRQLRALDTLTVLYHQRQMKFRVVWTKPLEGTKEYQVGLKAFSQEKEAWGLSLFNSSAPPRERISTASATA